MFVAEAVGWILDSLDDINSLSDGVASRDLDFMQHVFRDKTLHMLMEVVLHSSLVTILCLVRLMLVTCGCPYYWPIEPFSVDGHRTQMTVITCNYPTELFTVRLQVVQ